MFLIAAAFLLLVLQNASATTTESDTVWTKSLFPCEIKGSSFSLTGDSIIALAGAGTTDTLFILETATGKTLKSYKCKPWVYSFSGFVHFNTKSWVAISIEDYFGGMYIYDYLEDSIVNEKFGFLGKAIAITKDDKYIYVQNNSSSINNISIYDVEKGEVIDSISSSYGTSHSLAISPDNKYLAIGTGKLKRVNPYPDHPDYEEDRMYDKLVIIDLEKKEIIKEFDGPSGTEGEIREIKFSPDGMYLGVAKLDGTVRIYDIFNLELYRKFIICDYSDNLGPFSLSFSRDNKYILTGLYALDYSTKVYDIEANNLIKSLKVPSFTGLDATTKDSILTSYSSQITLLASNILTDIKDSIKENKDTSSIIINKLKNPTYQFNYNHLINSIKLYNYNGNSINTDNIIKVLNDVIRIETGNLGTGIYFLNINENSKIFKILISE